MPAGRGREIDAGLPGYAWVARIVGAVQERTGAPTRWNGRLYEEADERYAGAAEADGSLTISARDVMAPAEYAYTNRELADEHVRNAVDAAATVCHEARHLSSPLPDISRPDAHPTRDAPGIALDEGLVERWTHANFGAVLRAIDMNRVVPGSAQHMPTDAYPAYTSATHRLITDLAASTGRPPRELEQQLLECDAAQRWNLIADLAIDEHLSGLMPDSDREVVRARFANALRADFGHAQQVHLSDADDEAKRRQGTEIGARTVGSLTRDLEELADQYRESRQSRAIGVEARGAAPAADTSHLHRAFAGQPPAAGAAVAPAQAPGTASRRASTARSSGRDGPHRS